MLFIFQTVELMYLGESSRNLTASWAPHFSRRSVIFNFENLLLHQLFLEVRTICFLQHLNKVSGNIWKIGKAELALNCKMKTLEKGELKQVIFVCLTALISKAKCPLITSSIRTMCALQQVWILGIQASNGRMQMWLIVQFASTNLCVRTFYLNRQKPFEWVPHKNVEHL